MKSQIFKQLIIIIIAIGIFLILPWFASIINVPVYMIEPMRLLTIIALLHFRLSTAIVLAALLPIVSWLSFSHPPLGKATIIAVELLINIWIFYFMTKKIKFNFVSMFIALTVSKIVCYLLYIPFFSKEFLISELEPNFLIAQFILIISLSLYAQIVQSVTSRKTTSNK